MRHFWGAMVAQLVKHLSLGFSSGQSQGCEMEPHLELSAETA